MPQLALWMTLRSWCFLPSLSDMIYVYAFLLKNCCMATKMKGIGVCFSETETSHPTQEALSAFYIMRALLGWRDVRPTTSARDDEVHITYPGPWRAIQSTSRLHRQNCPSADSPGILHNSAVESKIKKNQPVPYNCRVISKQGSAKQGTMMLIR